MGVDERKKVSQLATTTYKEMNSRYGQMNAGNIETGVEMVLKSQAVSEELTTTGWPPHQF